MTTDADLVDAFLSSAKDAALVEIVRRHQIPVYRRLAVTLDNPDDAESVCETAFLVASQRFDEWSRDVELRDWLFDVAREVSATRRGEPADPESPTLVDPATYFKHSVHRALHTLSDDQRELLLSVDLEEQPVEAVAERRGEAVERVTESLDIARDAFARALAIRQERADAARPPVQVRPGDVIDKRYRVESLLGKGGMAEVFRAEHLAIKRKVAIKTLLPTRQTQSMLRERFTREAEVLGKLDHPNFVDVSDFGESTGGLSYLVMELLKGHSLAFEIRDRRALPPRRALRIARQLCLGLEFAHANGIVHRDIKPENVVIVGDETEDGFAKILDLGFAQTAEDRDLDGATLYGTPAYMAPEQIRGSRLDGRVDIYAVGIMLFELLSGELPFTGSTVEVILAEQITRAPPRLAHVAPGVEPDEALQAILDGCLAKEPSERTRNAAALRAQIEAILETLDDPEDADGYEAPESLAPGLSRTTHPPEPGRGSGRAWILWVLLLAAVIAVAVRYLI